MARRFKNLENIRVSSPCQADWDAMAGDDRARFCLECNQNVYNLSAMTRAQATSLVSDSPGKLCARFSLRPDGTLLTLEPAAATYVSRGRASRLAAASFTAVLSLCASVFAQSTAQVDESHAPASHADVKHANRQPPNEARRKKKTAKLHGTVYDIQESVVPQTKITLIDERMQRELAFETNDEGIFAIDGLQAGLYTLVAEYPGFANFRKTGIKLSAGANVRLDVTMQLPMMGEIINLDEPVVKNPALNFVVETLSYPYRGLRKIVKAVPR